MFTGPFNPVYTIIHHFVYLYYRNSKNKNTPIECWSLKFPLNKLVVRNNFLHFDVSRKKGGLRMRKLIIMIVFCLFLSSCDTKSSSDSEIVTPAAVNADVDKLSSITGNPDVVKASAMLPQERALSAANDYSPRTGKWFEDVNGFNLITSITSGETAAGDEASVSLSKIPEGRSVRFQVTSRDSSGKRIELLKEHVADINNMENGNVNFTFKMPESPSTNYLLSIEILSSKGVVEDTLISPLFVPSHELNARLKVDAPEKDSDRTTLTLFNAGSTDLYLGYGYEVYRYEPKGWKLVPPNDGAIESIVLHVKPGQSFHENVLFSKKLDPGQYRLVKQIEGYKTDLSVKLAADFEIR